MADREGFEPSLDLRLNTLSKRAPSTTRPPAHLSFAFKKTDGKAVTFFLAPRGLARSMLADLQRGYALDCVKIKNARSE